MQELLWDVFMDGVWGPNAKHDGLTEGGPECAAQSSLRYKLIVNAILLPYHIAMLKWGNKILSEDFPKRHAILKAQNLIKPTLAEKCMGYFCIMNLLITVFLKIKSKFLIFMFNPCHFVNAFLVVVSLKSHSRIGELCAIAAYSSAFGGYIGIIFNENVGFNLFELMLYHSEHAFASWLGPLVLALSGRYDFRSYFKFPLPWFGFILFTCYERYILMPLSILTWANLNHALCGVDNDPFFALLDLGESYYFWADAYLLFSCMVGYVLNFVIISTVFFVLKTVGSSAELKVKDN